MRLSSKIVPNTRLRDALDLLFQFNHPRWPALTHDGAGILPAQTRWLISESGMRTPYGQIPIPGTREWDAVYSALLSRTISEGFAYTHEDVPPNDVLSRSPITTPEYEEFDSSLEEVLNSTSSVDLAAEGWMDDDTHLILHYVVVDHMRHRGIGLTPYNLIICTAIIVETFTSHHTTWKSLNEKFAADLDDSVYRQMGRLFGAAAPEEATR